MDFFIFRQKPVPTPLQPDLFGIVRNCSELLGSVKLCFLVPGIVKKSVFLMKSNYFFVKVYEHLHVCHFKCSVFDYMCAVVSGKVVQRSHEDHACHHVVKDDVESSR